MSLRGVTGSPRPVVPPPVVSAPDPAVPAAETRAATATGATAPVDGTEGTDRARRARETVGATGGTSAPTADAAAPEGSVRAGSLGGADDLARRRAGGGATPRVASGGGAAAVDDHLPEEAVSSVTPERRMDRVDLTPEERATMPLSERIVTAAERNVGYDSRTNGGERCREGRGACAWAVNRMLDAAGVPPLHGRPGHPGAGLAPSREELNRMARDGRAERIEVTPDTTSLPPGAIICSSDPRGRGHIGIVGRDGTHIYSNASRDGMWEQNYDSPRDWYNTFTGDGGREVGPTYAYVLRDPAEAATTSSP